MESVRKPDIDALLTEATFTASRSSGPGGQNVNKVNSRITLRFDVDASQVLTPEQKLKLHQKLRSKISADGALIITAQEGRSQFDNREGAARKFGTLIEKAFETQKPRKKTKPSKAAKEKRVKSKKLVSEKKKWRQKPL